MFAYAKMFLSVAILLNMVASIVMMSTGVNPKIIAVAILTMGFCSVALLLFVKWYREVFPNDC